MVQHGSSHDSPDGPGGRPHPGRGAPRVLIVLPSFGAGGAERVAVNLANGLLAAGAAPSVVLTGASGPLGHRLDPRAPLLELGRRRVRAALPAVIRHIRDQRPDVVLATHTHVNLALCAVRWLLPRPTRLVLRIPMHAPTDLEGRSTAPNRRAQRLLYRAADLVLATSSTMAADLATFVTTRIEVLPNPVDVTGLRAGVTVTRAPDRAARRFLMVGRLRQQKAVDDLIGAFAVGSDPADRLDILGEGPERPVLEDLVRRSGLAERVTLPGVTPDPWDDIAGADALVLASRNEGMPNVVLEALALGTPVIATTDLHMLVELAAAAPPGAITLVARAELARAVGDTRPLPPGTVLPRPSLLPAEHTVEASSRHLLHLLSTLERAGGTR